MTRTKAWRLSLAAILGFGWLFLTPAYSDDPLSLAAQEIQELNQSVSSLGYKDEFVSLIDIAEDKYDDAVAAKEARDDAYDAYDAAVAAEAAALSEKNLAQSAVDGQTVTVATALEDKNDAQDALDIANINLQTTQSAVQNAGSSGLQYTVYYLARQWPGIAVTAGQTGCTGVLTSSYMQPGASTCYRYENFIVKFTGKITVPQDWNSTYFAGYTDDGFRMYVDGQLAVDNWREQGSTWSPMSPVYDVSQDKTLDVEIWWYNGGGPGYFHLGWAIPGGWTGVYPSAMSYGSGATQAQIDAYNAAVTAQSAAQTDYNNKLSAYNTANSTLTTYNQTLTTKNTAYNTAVTNTANALNAKNNATSNYNQAIIDMNNAIDDAWESYNNQFEFEEKQRVAAAIAQAMANQPQPTPEPSIEPTPKPTPEISPEPSPEPSPEQTEQVDPTPEPTTDTTDEETVDPTPTPEPSPEPSVEPSSQPEDITPTPEPEPTQDQTEIFDKTENTPVNSEMANLIADLTNSNTLAKLTPEQALAVSKTLGVAPQELKLVAELAKSDPTIATALKEFGDRANANLDAPMPYTLADAATEVQAEAFLANPLGAVFNVDPLELLSNFSELGMDMTDDQREKAQEVIIPVVLVSNIVATAIGIRR